MLKTIIKKEYMIILCLKQTTTTIQYGYDNDDDIIYYNIIGALTAHRWNTKSNIIIIIALL